MVVEGQVEDGTNSSYTATRDLFRVPSNSLKNMLITKLWLLFSYSLLFKFQLGFSYCKCIGQQVIKRIFKSRYRTQHKDHEVNS